MAYIGKTPDGVGVRSRFYFTQGSSGATSLSGNDDAGKTLTFSDGAYVDVLLNGVGLVAGTDYNTTTANTIAGLAALASGDVVEVVVYDIFTVADTVSAGSGGTFAGAVTFDAGANFGDNEKAQFGAGNDLQIYHDGSDSYVAEVGSGSLYVGADSTIVLSNAAVTTTKAQFITGGAVNLFHNNSQKFATTSTGVDVTGKIEADNASNPALSGVTNRNTILQLQNTDTGYVAGNATAIDFGTSLTSATASIIGRNHNAGNGYGGDLIFATSPTSGNSLTERVRVDSSGNVLVATTDAAPRNLSSGGGIRLASDGSIEVAKGLAQAGTFNRTGNDGQVINVRRNGTTTGNIGTNESYGYIAGTARGLRFGHSGSGAQIVPVTASGQASDDNVDLGAANIRFDDVYATSGVTTGSDENDKQQIASLTAAEMTAAKAISKLFKTFKWNSAVAAKGDAARTHTGVMAQQVETALTDAGLNAGDYAFYMSNTWWEVSTDVPAVEADEEAGIEAENAYTRIDTYDTADKAPEGATQRTRLGIRYAELLAFIGAATEQRLADIETRLAALEAAE